MKREKLHTSIIIRADCVEKTIEGKIKTFKNNKVWMTKKARMEAEARCYKNQFHLNLLIIIYTTAILSLSVWSLVNSSPNISLLTTCSSIALLVFTLFFNSMRLNERTIHYRLSYLDLTRIEDKLDNILWIKDENEKHCQFQDIKKEYYSTLEKTDNHTDYDYFNVIKDDNVNPSLTVEQFKKLHRIKKWKNALLTLAYILPIVPLIIFLILEFL